MDFSKIFLKGACPTHIGGQAVIEGVMMRGSSCSAIAIRLPNGEIHLKKEKLPKPSRAMKIPFVRGIFILFAAMLMGTRILMYSADVAEKYERENTEKEKKTSSGIEAALIRRFGENRIWNFMLAVSVIFAIVISLGVFAILPTLAVGMLKTYTDNTIVLNLVEGILRILIFITYVLAISKMKDVYRLFQYHGAEHKTIHCFENRKELTAENCKEFLTIHPRCGTSFFMFVMIISLVLFSFLGWPTVFIRTLLRIVFIPVIAGLSYELLKFAAGRDSRLIRILSVPGFWMQMITTNEPDEEQLEVAIAAMNAVLEDEGRQGSQLSGSNPEGLQICLPGNAETEKDVDSFNI